MEYLLWLIGLFVAGIVLEWKLKLKIFSSMKQRVIIILLIYAIFVVLDYYGTYRGFWTWLGPHLTGWKIWNLPIEEHVAWLAAPYFIITLFYSFKKIRAIS